MCNRTSCAQVYDLSQSHCGEGRRHIVVKIACTYILCLSSFCEILYIYINYIPMFAVLNKFLSVLLYTKIYHNWDYSSLRKTHEQR